MSIKNGKKKFLPFYFYFLTKIASAIICILIIWYVRGNDGTAAHEYDHVGMTSALKVLIRTDISYLEN